MLAAATSTANATIISITINIVSTLQIKGATYLPKTTSVYLFNTDLIK